MYQMTQFNDKYNEVLTRVQREYAQIIRLTCKVEK